MARRVEWTALKPHRIHPQNWRPDMKQSYTASFMKMNVSNQTLSDLVRLFKACHLAVTIIPCNDLSIGTWRRIATAVGKHDLVAYLCDSKRCLTWFIHSAGYGFKMEIPFDIIVDTEFTNAAPGSGLASFILSQPPTFYLESFSHSGPNQALGQVRQWKKCADWTEGQQATKVLRHDLIGSAVQLAHLLRHLTSHASGSDIRLHSPTYYSQEPPPPLMDVPQPPMAGLAGPAYHYGDVNDSRRGEHPVHVRRRSFSGGSMRTSHLHRPEHQSLAVDLPINPTPGPLSAPYGSSSSFSPYSSRNHSSIHLSSHSPMFSEYADSVSPSSHSVPQQSQSPVDYGSVDTQSIPPRTYSSAPVHQIYDGTMSITSSYPSNGPSLSSTALTPFVTPSPPLLMTPFYPHTNTYSTRG
jgi:regulatory protein PHO2